MDNAVFLRLATGPLAAPVLSRVVSMVLARADCPMDRLDDAMIVCDALSAHGSAYAADGLLAFTVRTHGREMELRVGELSERGAESLVRDALVPGVGNVLERMSDELSVVLPGDSPGEQAGEELLLRLSFR